MKIFSKIGLTLFFLLQFSVVFSQDLIITKDGTNIHCRIISEDSLSIRYIRTAHKHQSVIQRSEVETYYTSKSTHKNQLLRRDGTTKKELLLLKVVAGVSNPLGEFASKDVNLPTSGYAKTGYAINPTLIIKLKPYFGFSAGYRYQRHHFDSDNIRNLYQATVSGVTFSTTSTNWVSSGFYGGLFFNLPVPNVNHLSVDFTLMGGVSKFVCPELVVIGRNRNSNVLTVSQYESSTTKPVLLTNLGINYSVNQLVTLNFGVNYFYSEPSFTNVLTVASNGFVDYHSFKQKISTINIEAGLSFKMFN